ncbi:DUF262 domain-containing protein [Pedobacter steynii]|uniref:GmrSD restriction endonucleases N-terminal domain-containing protein n=1 Tax=Pedobacter steynii TaxID=430522 RepID=A0A1D7QKQ3_9SPHI|nr:DUF262 domain-containing protein [Pedobacter steynii]AOM79193.1 hypothetical protein BFS30_19690 [Pedobacter steynii]
MAYIKTYDKNNRNILRINFERKLIQLAPDYQRNGDIWTLEKRQLLIDSILNDYDIPKIYFHVLDKRSPNYHGQEYAVIDGRQRLETIWMFLDGKFKLAEDFKFFKDSNVKVANFTYADLAKDEPELKGLFDSFDLPIVCVETDDLDLIDDMFLRLNEAVPLNAAEKRNAIRGPMVQSINNICKNDFLIKKVKFSNTRYQHKEVACRLLYLTWTLTNEKKIYDTKKVYLDEFVRAFKQNKVMKSKPIESAVVSVLDKMNTIFHDNDNLLRSQGIIPIYYLAFKDAISNSITINRKDLVEFRDEIQKNKSIAETDISKANYDLIEFDRLSLQGTNDAGSIRERLRILKEYLKIPII